MTNPKNPLPSLVVHCDWSTSSHKRRMAAACLRRDGRYLARSTEQVPIPASSLIPYLYEIASSTAGSGSVLVGFDFPIGLPVAYAHQFGLERFLDLLPLLGKGEWGDFFIPAVTPGEISLQRPFYPARPGFARQFHLTQALGAPTIDSLRRQCDLPHPGRRAACPLFWTMGAQQVGKAAISGWRDVLQPALASYSASIWPFSGSLAELVARPGSLVLAETYPAEVYAHLGIKFARGKDMGGKRSPSARKNNAPALLEWAAQAGIDLEGDLSDEIQAGFGDSGDSEDRFDAVAGLFGMLNVVLGARPSWEPIDQSVLQIEGWILGQATASTLDFRIR
jgi:hypothetical protein